MTTRTSAEMAHDALAKRDPKVSRIAALTAGILARREGRKIDANPFLAAAGPVTAPGVTLGVLAEKWLEGWKMEDQSRLKVMRKRPFLVWSNPETARADAVSETCGGAWRAVGGIGVRPPAARRVMDCSRRAVEQMPTRAQYRADALRHVRAHCEARPGAEMDDCLPTTPAVGALRRALIFSSGPGDTAESILRELEQYARWVPEPLDHIPPREVHLIAAVVAMMQACGREIPRQTCPEW